MVAMSIEQSPRPERQRRNRRPKACRPCRERKVRCNYGQPCGTCVRRHHPQLCSYYGSPANSQEQQHIAAELLTSRIISKGAGPLHSPVSHISQQSAPDGPLSPLEASSNTSDERLFAILDHIQTAATASWETDPVTGQVTFIGPRAPATIFRTLLPYLSDETIPPNSSIESIFGLTSRAISQPFVSLWNTTAQVTLGDILRSLPSAETCVRYYRSYQQIAHPFFPILDDTAAFERSLCHTLEQLDVEEDVSSPAWDQPVAHLPHTKLAEYALLFAVIASGCQCCLTAESDHKLALATRVFVACSFECLRLANMYVAPSSETIQATLILASVTCNDGNPGVAAGLLGMAAQHAQSLGMHIRRDCEFHSSTCTCSQSMHPLWRAVIIIDSKLSLIYDRIPVSRIPDSQNCLQSLICASYLEFWDFAFMLHCLQVRWQSLGGQETRISIAGNVIQSYLDHTIQLRELASSARSSLYRPDSVHATIEQLVFLVQLEFFAGMLHFQATIITFHSPEIRLHHFHDMVAKFCLVITTYIKLARISPIAKLAWELLRAVKSSAVILATFEAVLGENLTECLLRRFARMLTKGSKLRTWGDDAVPTSCLAGIETLNRLLRAQSNTPIMVAELPD